MPVFPSEFFKIGETVNINMHTQFLSLFNFGESDIVGSIKNVCCRKPSFQCQFRFVNGTAVHITTNLADITKHIDICQSLGSIKKTRPTSLEGSLQSLVLLLDA